MVRDKKQTIANVDSGLLLWASYGGKPRMRRVRILLGVSCFLFAVMDVTGDGFGFHDGTSNLTGGNALTISVHGPTIASGSEFEGEVVLKQSAVTPVTVRLVSSAPEHVTVKSSAVIIASGQRSTIFVYRGHAPGSAMLRATASTIRSGAALLIVSADHPGDTLRSAGAGRRLLMGAAAIGGSLGYASPLLNDATYAAVLGKQYSMLEPEVAMKWIVLHPERDRYDFRPADELVNFALANDMKIRGHALCWSDSNPKWLDAYLTASPTELQELLHHHIQAVMFHFRGKVFAWDVLNEAIDDRTTGSEIRMRDSIWHNKPGIGLNGADYIEQVFRWAHEADPDALLFYNENNVEQPGDKFEALYHLMVGLLTKGVPISGVGIQAHMKGDSLAAMDGLSTNIRRLTALGLQVHLTEVDVPLSVDREGRTARSNLERQAQAYESLLKICLRNPGCTGFQTWGFTDAHSWIPIYMPGFGQALPFDVNYKPKPAYNLMMNALTGSRSN